MQISSYGAQVNVKREGAPLHAPDKHAESMAMDGTFKAHAFTNKAPNSHASQKSTGQPCPSCNGHRQALPSRGAPLCQLV